jgi:hypothetical protein
VRAFGLAVYCEHLLGRAWWSIVVGCIVAFLVCGHLLLSASRKQGIDDPEYELWHAQRKTMSNIFFRSNFEGFLQHVFARHARVLCDVLRTHAAAGTVVDVQAAVFNFTLDSIAEIGFGVPFHALREPMPVAASFDFVQEMVALRLMRPLYQVRACVRAWACLGLPVIINSCTPCLRVPARVSSPGDCACACAIAKLRARARTRGCV